MKKKRSDKLGNVPLQDRYEHVQYGSKLHSDAYVTMVTVHHAIWLNQHPEKIPAKHAKLAKQHYEKAVQLLIRRFSEAWNRKNGDFFRALGDVFEPDNAAFSRWTPLEKMVYTDCSMAEELGEPLPSAGQLLRAWKIKCGVVPTRKTDLEFVWNAHVGGPMPKSRASLERALCPSLGKPNQDAADIQIKQIQDAARNVGYTLPKQARRACLPAGCGVIPD